MVKMVHKQFENRNKETEEKNGLYAKIEQQFLNIIEQQSV